MKPIKTTHLLIALNVLIFILMLGFGGKEELVSFSQHTLLVFGADYAPFVRMGQWYRPFASMFIHMNAIHLGMNMMALYQVGIALEQLYGRGRYTFLYIVSGLLGAALSLAWHWRTPAVSAGASGAITGLIGAAAVASHFAGPAGVPLRNMMLRWLVTVFVLGVMIKADNAAHLGGLIGGAALGFTFRGVPPMIAARNRDLARRKPDRPGLESLILVALVAGHFGVAFRNREQALSAAELVNRGVELARGGKDVEAIAHYRRAIEQEPDDATAWYDLGLALGRQGDHDGAVQALSRATELPGVDADGNTVAAQAHKALVNEHMRFAQAQEKADKLDAAEAAVKQALALEPNDTDNLAVLAYVQAKKGDRPAAIASLRAALALKPGDGELKKQLSTTLTNHAVSLADADKHQEAVAFYREAITVNPEDHYAWYDLGISLEKLKDYEGARAALERSIELHPRPSAYELLASVYFHLGQADKAMAALEAAKKTP